MMIRKLVIALCALSLAASLAFADDASMDALPRRVSTFSDAAEPAVTPLTMAQVKVTSHADTAAVETAADVPEQKTTAPSQQKKILLNLASRILTLYQGDVKIRMYPVGVGKPDTPSPIGHYRVTTKEVNPTWIDPDSSTVIPSGPDCPLGYRWMGLFGNYGIHGTNVPSSIGGYVSHGCIRMHEADVEDLYDHTPLGTPVDIFYDRIVIDRNDDHTISYYIYPDGYGWQPLTVDRVKKALAGYGVEDFAENQAIYNKIVASDGQPTYVAKAYDLVVNGKTLKKRALGKDGRIWLPAFALSSALKLDSHWDSQQKVFVTARGQAAGIIKSDVVYVDSAMGRSLYGLEGHLTKDYVYTMTTVSEEVPNAQVKAKEAKTAAASVPSLKERMKTGRTTPQGLDN